MRVISVPQPWASLIALEVKRIHTLGFPTPYRGRVAIHASQRVDGFPRRIFGGHRVGDFTVQRNRQGLVLHGRDSGTQRLPVGSIVALATLTECLPIVATEDDAANVALVHDSSRREALLHRHSINEPSQGPGSDFTSELAYANFTVGRFAWIFDDISAVGDGYPPDRSAAMPAPHLVSA